MLLLPLAFAAEVPVTDVAALRDAVAAALPGDTIVLAAGEYTLDDTLRLAVPGDPDAPITLRGDGATIVSETTEALKISAPYWHVEDLTFRGACATDDECEHALHIVGEADGTWVRGNTLVDFNAQIKGNGEEVDGAYAWPDDVLVEGNDFHDTRARDTSNPVTKVDVVGGRRWRLVANRISDFQKGGGDGVSYAAFFKGNSRDGVMERNLVVCAEAYEGGTRLGLSLGGGGTSPDSICEDGTCSPEHQGGVLRNNLVAHCSDVGVYLNEAADTTIVGNTLYDTAGIDVRYEASSATVACNVLDGRIRERDDGTLSDGGNWAGNDLGSVFLDPDALDFTLVQDPGLVDGCDVALEEDFCGAARDASPDGGALEYTTASPCDTTMPHRAEDGGDTGDTGDTGGGDSGADDTAGDDGGGDSAEDGDGGGDVAKDGGCGCASGGAAGAWLGVWAAAWIGGRRRARRPA